MLGSILMERKITQKDTYLVMFKEYPDVVDVEQMSKMIGISTKTAYKLLRENKIQHFKIGRTYKIPKLNILLYINVV
jgi:excisionase family DNA binding protein